MQNVTISTASAILFVSSRIDIVLSRHEDTSLPPLQILTGPGERWWWWGGTLGGEAALKMEPMLYK